MTELDPSVANGARVHNYLLGGKDNFAADRQAGDALRREIPGLPQMTRATREFMRRAVTHMAGDAGIRQFLDVGAGLPSSPNLHEVAQNIAADSRVVYVDNDPIVAVHGRALMTSTPQGCCPFAEADLRQPRTILDHPSLTSTIDLTQPVGLTLLGVLAQLADTDHPAAAVAELRDAVPCGSLLAISHLTADFAPRPFAKALTAAAKTGIRLYPRPEAAVHGFFGDWELLEPGLVPVSAWRPEDDSEDLPTAHYWAGLARKP
uniref:SAM-dependent methyltransferase n=1 Tax=Paractinoplanes polyasparticus TaxID=2856853 RepID=UPI0027DEB587|nr:SAM-dependent methyltransferase [Actinoplanes polyasparticus]